jgi:GxxExxY protein
MAEIVYKEESYKVIGICMEVHRILGKGFLEIVYKDALEYEFQKAKIPYTREKEYVVHYKVIILNHKYYADFVVYDKIILEIKAKSTLTDEHVATTLNYVTASGNKLGLLINFGEMSLVYKRIVV